jgi:hydroxyethylthiazole kinase-like uncharacterized protein yjeF
MKELLEKLQRDPESHKGENGRVGIIAGSRDYTGAPALSAKAVLRTGCDLATILTSSSVSSTVAGYSENFIVRDYISDYFDMNALEKALELDKEVDAIVIGPGLGNPDSEAVREFIKKCESPVVVDADALEHISRTSIENAVLTPHRAEFEALSESLGVILENDNIVVKKGSKDTIYSKNGETEVETGNPTMTVGGTGDVLTGVIASLISQSLDLEEAASLGIWLNGKAGEKAAEELGNGALATDIVERIPEIISNPD